MKTVPGASGSTRSVVDPQLQGQPSPPSLAAPQRDPNRPPNPVPQTVVDASKAFLLALGCLALVVIWPKSYTMPAHPVGCAVVAGGRSYTAVAHEPDGTGMSRLLLEVA